MRTRLLLLAAALATLAGCGDDPKQGTRGAPAAAPGGAPPVPPAAPAAAPAPSPTAAPTPPPAPPAPTPTRAGDWATWEVRLEGSESLTRLTWRALRVEGDRVRFAVESRTTDAAGREIASARTEEVRGIDAPPAPAAAAETVTVGGRPLPATTSREGDAEVTRSPLVPFGGLVRLRGPGGVTQTLVAFGRGA